MNLTLHRRGFKNYYIFVKYIRIESVNIVSDDVDFSDIDETTRAIVRNVICDKIGMSDYALALAIHKSRPWPECLIS